MAKRSRTSGFTLIELMVVVAVIGILAGIAVPRAIRTLQRAKENRLKHDLRVMRDLIQQFRIDKKRCAASLENLVEEEYLKAVPTDAVSGNAEWEVVFEEVDPDEDPLEAEDCIVDVRSLAPGQDLDGVPFSEY